MFLGVTLWCLFLVNGAPYVYREHAADFQNFLQDARVSHEAVKAYVANHVLVRYVFNASQVVLFFLGTMSIVEVLNRNGCFKYVSRWLRTGSSRRLLWGLALFAYLLSANLDNMTTAVLMLVLMHPLVNDNRLRMFYGSIIILAVNCGGMLTVIGDINSLTLWTRGFVTPTVYTSVLFLPSLLMLAVPTWLIGRKLPVRINRSAPFYIPYDQNDDTLPVWQTVLMLFVGIGGLWFIPTFHRLTYMPPFVGAFCVLGLLWVINEFCNLRFYRSDRMVTHRSPVGLQYGNVQMLLFYIGLTLTVGVTQEMGVLRQFSLWLEEHVHNIYIMCGFWGMLSSVLDNIIIILNNTAMYPFDSDTIVISQKEFSTDGIYWPLLNYLVTFGGSLLTIGTVAGFALMKVEGVTIKWYVRHVTGKVLLGGLLGLLALLLSVFAFS